MVERPEPKPKPGSIVEIVDRNGEFAGRGFYNGHSRISLRVLSSDIDEAIDDAFFARKISAAVSLRKDVLKLDAVTDAYRLVHSEGDGLSGLVVDRFADTLVIEFFSAGAFRQRDLIRNCLLEHYPGSAIYAYAEDHVQKQESFDCATPARPKPTVIHEHGVRFHAAPGSKHKTGFFVDQRDNRLTLAGFCEGKRVLDLCCNSGGFGIAAKTIGAASAVVGVDLDEEILAIAEQNAHLNKAKVRFVQADIFHWLRDYSGNRAEKFDVVILDPAKMTRDREQVIPCAQEVPGHEQAGDGCGEARRHPVDLFVHGPGERGGVSRHAAACGVLCRAQRAGPQGERCRRGPSLARACAGESLPEGRVLSGRVNRSSRWLRLLNCAAVHSRVRRT
jgi:23S rRNA (cytosine1962-C5)-methyltransferase